MTFVLLHPSLNIFPRHVVPSRLNASFTFFPFSIKTRWFLSRERSNEKITFSAYSVFFKCFSYMLCSICNKDITNIRRHSISNSMLRSICILTEEPYNFFLFMVECRNATAMTSLHSLCKTKRCVLLQWRDARIQCDVRMLRTWARISRLTLTTHYKYEIF